MEFIKLTLVDGTEIALKNTDVVFLESVDGEAVKIHLTNSEWALVKGTIDDVLFELNLPSL